MVISNERNRIRRQMQRRIREVVAERRSARQNASPVDRAVAPLVPVPDYTECNAGGA